MTRYRDDADDVGKQFHYTPAPRRGDPYAAGRHRESEPAPSNRAGATIGAANLVHDREFARMRARFIDGTSAWTELVDQLNIAHLSGGKPSLAVLAARVRYSKATLSKVLGGKMMPSWKLVELLGEALHVPSEVVVNEWFRLWTAAEMHRAKRWGAIRGTAKVPAPGARAEPQDTIDTVTGTASSPAAAIEDPDGYTCLRCGSWVVDTTVHTDWHMRMEPAEPEPPAEPITGAAIAEREIRLLRAALGQDDTPA
ncbi:helix-turn-helix transcriptional regulator [Actinoplanes missouriensis]|uniref:helix-turn-helix domain-containing protein n=1 Tax=Actinoplanes missouriensis TaxID=1866 RepID=UPI0033C05D29